MKNLENEKQTKSLNIIENNKLLTENDSKNSVQKDKSNSNSSNNQNSNLNISLNNENKQNIYQINPQTNFPSKEYFNYSFFKRQMSSRSSDVDIIQDNKEGINEFFNTKYKSILSKDSEKQNNSKKSSSELNSFEFSSPNLNKDENGSQIILTRANSDRTKNYKSNNYIPKTVFFQRNNSNNPSCFYKKNGNKNNNKINNEININNHDNLVLKYYGNNDEFGNNINKNLLEMVNDNNDELDENQENTEEEDDDDDNNDDCILTKKEDNFSLFHRGINNNKEKINIEKENKDEILDNKKIEEKNNDIKNINIFLNDVIKKDDNIINNISDKKINVNDEEKIYNNEILIDKYILNNNNVNNNSLTINNQKIFSNINNNNNQNNIINYNNKYIQPPPPQKEIDDFLKNVFLYTKDQQGCRYIQKKIEEIPSISNNLFNLLYNDILLMSRDLFGNYVIQKIIENLNPENLFKFVDLITKDFFNLSISIYGTRVVQKILELVSKENYFKDKEIYEKCFLIINKNITDNIVPLSSNNNSSHIILKYIVEIKFPKNEKFYFEVYNNFIPLCKNKHGCCIIQKCIEFSNIEQKNKLLELSKINCDNLITDQFGNYVIQYVLGLNTEIINIKVLDILKKNLTNLCKEKYASNVIEKFLMNKSKESFEIINILLMNENYLHELIIDPFGNYIIQRILSIIEGDSRSNLIKYIVKWYPEIKLLPFGPRLISKLHERFQEFTLLVTQKYGWETTQEISYLYNKLNLKNILTSNNNKNINGMYYFPNIGFINNSGNQMIGTNNNNNFLNFKNKNNVGNINFIQMNNYMLANGQNNLRSNNINNNRGLNGIYFLPNFGMINNSGNQMIGTNNNNNFLNFRNKNNVGNINFIQMNNYMLANNQNNLRFPMNGFEGFNYLNNINNSQFFDNFGNNVNNNVNYNMNPNVNNNIMQRGNFFGVNNNPNFNNNFLNYNPNIMNYNQYLNTTLSNLQNK